MPLKVGERALGPPVPAQGLAEPAATRGDDREGSTFVRGSPGAVAGSDLSVVGGLIPAAPAQDGQAKAAVRRCAAAVLCGDVPEVLLRWAQASTHDPGAVLPRALRDVLQRLQERSEKLQHLPYSPWDREVLQRTLVGQRALTVLAWLLDNATTPAGAALLAVLRDVPPVSTETQPSSHALGIYHNNLVTYVREHLPGLMPSLLEGACELREPMPVLDEIVAEVTRGGRAPLARYNVLVVGHILAEAPTFLRALEKMGLDRRDAHVGPVPYSSNELAIEAVARQGYDVVRDATVNARMLRFSDLLALEGERGRALKAQLNGAAALMRQVREALGVRAQVGDAYMARKGYDIVSRAQVEVDAHAQLGAGIVDYEHTKEAQIDELVSRALRDHARNGKPIVVFDDGGYVAQAVQERFPEQRHLFKFIEQTTRGIRKAEALGSAAPSVINVAGSRPKRLIEGPFIGDAVGQALVGSLRPLLGEALAAKGALVLGYGVVGSAVARALRAQGMRVSVYDIDGAAGARAAADGLVWMKDKAAALRGQDLVVGCTGTQSLTQEEIAQCDPGVVIASASSVDVEMRSNQSPKWGVMDVRMQTWLLPGSAGVQVRAPQGLDAYARDTLPRLLESKRDAGGFGVQADLRVVLNGGFPINFTRQLQAMPARRIQVTLACLAGAVDQLEACGPGVQPLASGMQQVIWDSFKRHAPQDCDFAMPGGGSY